MIVHDDGFIFEDWEEVDIILMGVLCSLKILILIYLVNWGYKVVNVLLVVEFLFLLLFYMLVYLLIVGLIISVERFI